MDEKQVIDKPYATYYLQLQGSEGRALFTDAEECQLLHDLLPLAHQVTGADILGYCLLDDCVHLLAQAGEDGIAPLGEWLIAEYTQVFNQRHQRNGSVFYADFLFTLLEAKQYLLPALHQLHRLPVQSGLVADPAIYPWSSHRDYLAIDAPSWLQRTPALEQLAHQRPNALGRYARFMALDTQPTVDWINGDHPSFYALASDSYLRRLMADTPPPEQPQSVDLESLTAWVCHQRGLSLADMQVRHSHRQAYEIRALVTCLAVNAGLASVEAVAAHFGEDPELLAGAAGTLREQRLMTVYRLEQAFHEWLATVPVATTAVPDHQPAETGAAPATDTDSQAPEPELGKLADEFHTLHISPHTH